MIPRKFKRVQLACQAMVMSGSDNFYALTENISLNGLLLRDGHPVPVGSVAMVTLTLPSASTSSPVTVNGEVVRSDGRGLALHFKSLSHDTFSQLRTVVGRKPRDS